jgi:DNA repair exonuclease SbcCD ATPase subunit
VRPRARQTKPREGQGAEDQQALLNRALRGQFRDADEARLAGPLIREQIGQLRDSPGANREFAQAQIERLESSLAAAEEAVATFERMEGYGRDPATSAPRGGTSRGDVEAAAWERYQDALDRAREQQEAMIALEEESKARREEALAEILDQEEQKREAYQETIRLQAEAEAEALEEQKDKALEAAEQIADANEARLDAAREQVAGYKEVTDVIVGGLTDALASIADGSKTAESAFLGLLAGFLKFVAEKAALSAAEEAAQAIAAYARYDYSSGAQHTAAAVAFGAVAIAAGAGSAAASSAASSAGRASEPERGRSQGGGDRSGGQIVINFQSPVITSGTRAELGRELQQTIEAGRSRYG